MTPPPPSSSHLLHTPTKTQHLHFLQQTISLAKLSPPKPSNFRVGCVLVSYPQPHPHLHSSALSSSSSSSSPAAEQEPSILSSGYTLELPGNTHAEQNALAKLLDLQTPSTTSTTTSTSTSTTTTKEEEEEDVHLLLPKSANVYLYTSLEPCSVRLSGNKTCVNRILDTTNKGDGYGIRKVIFGAKEPDTFVENSQSCKLLTEAGVEWEYIPDLEEEILKVAMEGHVKNEEEQGQKQESEASGDMSTLHARVDAMSANANTKPDVNNEEERRRQKVEDQPRNPKKRMMEYAPQ